jgi:uncharacterized membrane protein
MQIRSIFTLNDWEIKPFIILIISLLLAVWGFISLDTLGFTVPILRKVVGFLFLTFVPGLLFLRVLRIHHLGAVKTTVYSIGLSLMVLMFSCFVLNQFCFIFGITHPMALWPLVFNISCLTIILVILSFIRDRTFASPSYLTICDILSLPVLVFSLLPFFAIAGTYLMNFYNINLVLMFLLLVIAFVPVVIIFTNYIPKKFYAYAVFSLALTLVYHTSLISNYIWGWDIQYEYYLTNAVIQNSFWDPANFGGLNGMMSLMMLGPVYSLILNMNLIWVFKVIYPFLFAFVPFTLYELFKAQIEEKMAFLACFFFISFYSFYTDMLGLARQEIAELFCALILLSIIDNNLKSVYQNLFFIFFSMSLIVSHYGLSYLFMFILVLTWILTTIGHYVYTHKYGHRFFMRIQQKSDLFSRSFLQKIEFHSGFPSWNSTFFYVTFILAWYIYTTNSSNFSNIVRIANQITRGISSELVNPDTVQGLMLVTSSTVTPLHEIAKYLHLLTIFFIIIGFTFSVVRFKGIKFDPKYILLSFGAICICVGGVTLPYFASAINTSRLYQITLILLTPFCITGGVFLLNCVYSNIYPERFSKFPLLSIKMLSGFFVVFFLFNSGLIYELFNNYPTSFALNSSLDNAVFNKQEVSATLWLNDVKDNRPISVDRFRQLELETMMGRINYRTLKTDSMGNVDGYIYLGHYNIQNKQFLELQKITNTIYYCGGTRIDSTLNY